MLLFEYHEASILEYGIVELKIFINWENEHQLIFRKLSVLLVFLVTRPTDEFSNN